MNYGKSCDLINRSPPAERTTGSMASERERIFPQTPESWQFGNCGPLVECHVLLLRGTIVMAPHARSWGAIGPALRPPLSSVPGRSMAGAFYLRFFPNNLSPTTQVPQTTYAGRKAKMRFFCIHEWESRRIPWTSLARLWSDNFPCSLPCTWLLFVFKECTY